MLYLVICVFLKNADPQMSSSLCPRRQTTLALVTLEDPEDQLVFAPSKQKQRRASGRYAEGDFIVNCVNHQQQIRRLSFVNVYFQIIVAFSR